jgi:hypothetical protein
MVVGLDWTGPDGVGNLGEVTLPLLNQTYMS